MWDFKDGRPIYLQIIEQVKLSIVSGAYPPGGKVLSVRELAAEASVNPNTMQKALSELEREGLVYSQRTLGRFITEDREMIAGLRVSLAREQAEQFFAKMAALGYTKRELMEFLAGLEPEANEADKPEGSGSE
jgi:DNA-binding transcriptional regulator YhcF (GntR family)